MLPRAELALICHVKMFVTRNVRITQKSTAIACLSAIMDMDVSVTHAQLVR